MSFGELHWGKGNRVEGEWKLHKYDEKLYTNIKFIEKSFKVKVFQNGNKLKITGHDEDVKLASDALKKLYEAAGKGVEITKETLKKSISYRPISSLEDDFEKYQKRGFIEAISKKVSKEETAIIAEIKKASPSKGIIREDFEPKEIAKDYEANGATSLSVLTDEPFFQGKLEYLDMVRNTCTLPILRKDFMIDPYQIYETKASGGDCILLIVAALDLVELKDFSQLAKELNLDILIEVHSDEELNKALTIDPKLIGINNRDLITFEVDKNLAVKLAKEICKDVIVVSESGISSREDILFSKEQGIHSFLIGESFMKEPSPGRALKEIIA